MIKQTPLIHVEAVSYRNSQKNILSDINFNLSPAEIITIIGPNGAGKTSLLKLILGLLVPTLGRITRRPDVCIGYMPQKIEINPLLPLTVEGLLKLSQPQKISLHLMETILKQVGIPLLKEQSLSTLSGGEWQRVLLARALLRQPNLLILDEPAQGVDVVGQADFYQLLADLRDRLKCAILLVSHDLHLVMAATDHVICLNGHICCSGHPKMVMNDPHFQSLFSTTSRSGKLSILPYIHHHDHRHDGPCHDPA